MSYQFGMLDYSSVAYFPFDIMPPDNFAGAAGSLG
jgi:hypothetical protein